jgi:hypothetical protein
MAKDYYNLSDESTLRDVILSVRADESIHREVNHHFADLKADEEMDFEEVHIIDREQEKMEETEAKK